MTLSAGLALVFDMDGVIVDSMPVHLEAWRVCLKRLGITAHDLERRTHGLRNDDIVRDLFGAHLSAEQVREQGTAKERLYRELTGANLPAHLVPGVVEFLERSSAAPLAVASNAEPANVDFVLDGANLRRFFRVVIDGTQVENPKPYPDVYLKTADKLGVAPNNCIVFEDSPAGVQAARAAGTRVVGVETHGRLTGVDLHIANFEQTGLEQWLSEQRGARGGGLKA